MVCCSVLQRAPGEAGPVICLSPADLSICKVVIDGTFCARQHPCISRHLVPFACWLCNFYFLISRIYESKDGGVWRLSQIVKKESQVRVCNCISHLQTWFHSSPYVAPVTTNKALVSEIGTTLGALIFLGFFLYSLHSVCVTICYFPDYVFIILNMLISERI